MKTIYSTLRILALLAIVVTVAWRIASPQQRSEYLPWVPKLLSATVGIDVRDQLAYPPDSEQPHSDGFLSQLTQRLGPSNAGDTLEAIRNRIGHTLYAYPLCKQLQGDKVTTESRKVYQWTDANGQTHIGDAPPSNLAQASNTLTTKTLKTKNYFSLHIDQSRASLPVNAVDRFNSELEQIYQIIRLDIRIEEVRKVDLKLLLFDDHNEYLAYQNQEAPGLSRAATGFFNPRKGEAAIFTAGYAPQTFAITRHEATHAILSALYGELPIWFNEGMAEYFGSMQMAEQSKSMPVKQHHLEQIRQVQQEGDLPNLRDFFNFTPKTWYTDNNLPLRYATSWSLVFFLLADEERRQFTRHMMNGWGSNFCAPFDTLKYFETHYPRGLAQFEHEWLEWLNSKNAVTQRY